VITYAPLASIALNVIVAFSKLVRVTICEGLVVPTVCGPKLRLLGDRLRGGTLVPKRFRICGLLLALSEIVTDPDIAPIDVGLKFTRNVQLAPGDKLPLHGWCPLGEAEKLPLAARLVKLRFVVPEFVAVTNFEELVVPSAVFWNDRVPTENVSCPAEPPTPIPVSVNTCGLNAAL